MRKNEASIGRGSVTVYLSLTLGVMVSLIFAMMLSVKIGAGRMQAANSMDQALYSLFARFDRQAAEDFGLFFIWTGGEGGPDAGACIRELEDASDYLLSPTRGRLLFGGRSILKLERKSCAVTGYTLLTDAGGAPFRRQAVQAVKDTFGIEGITRLKELLEGTKQQEEQGRELMREADNHSYADLRREAEEARREREREAAEAGIEAEEPVVPPGFVNPLPFFEQLMKEAVLDIAAPGGVSDRTADPAALVSGRKLAKGIGIIDTEDGGGDLWLKAYIHKNFSSYKKASAHAVLAYQKEYILCGKYSDLDNMKETVHRLMLMREAANIASIYSDELLSAALSKQASLIAAAFGIPTAAPAVKLTLAAGWSYAESVVDVRALFMGKRVPLVKSSASWQTGLDQLTKLRGGIDDLTKDTQGGLRYDDYLGMLLTASGEDLTMRTLDMLEAELRGSGREELRLDTCITALSAEMEVCSEGRVTFPVKGELDYNDL